MARDADERASRHCRFRALPDARGCHADRFGCASRAACAFQSAADSILDIGNNDTHAGAGLNAKWYLGNAKIFAKLMYVAKPGDRGLAEYGAGHNYRLCHFAAETPGYKFIDPVPYLKAVKPVK